MSIRQACVAGSFYDSDPIILKEYIQHSLKLAKQEYSGKLKDVSMVLLPHAGHFYCGHVIAKTLAQIVLKKRLIILCPNHTGLGNDFAVWSKGSWQTPLGAIPIDEELSEIILHSHVGFSTDAKAHAREHSIEVLLPFLQIYLPEFSIVPIAVKSHDFRLLQKTGLALGQIIKGMPNDDISIIVSSDMHHFSNHEYTLALDNLALQALLDFDPLQLAKVVSDHKISMCGICPSIVAMFACQVLEACNCQQICHTTSFEKGGDESRVVGYASLVVQKNT